MRYPILAAMVMMTAVAAGRANAQGQTDPANKDPYQLKLDREENERKENERAYNATMKRLKSQAPATTSSDPWKSVRPADTNAKR